MIEYASSKGEYKDDPNAFLFSLDKQKMYSYKSDDNAIYNYKNNGPSFGNGADIRIYKHSIEDKKLLTYESSSSVSHNYNGDKNALSESNVIIFMQLNMRYFKLFFHNFMSFINIILIL